MIPTSLCMYTDIFFKLWSKVSQIIFIFFHILAVQLHISQIDKNWYNPFCDETSNVAQDTREQVHSTPKGLLGVGVL